MDAAEGRCHPSIATARRGPPAMDRPLLPLRLLAASLLALALAGAPWIGPLTGGVPLALADDDGGDDDSGSSGGGSSGGGSAGGGCQGGGSGGGSSGGGPSGGGDDDADDDDRGEEDEGDDDRDGGWGDDRDDRDDRRDRSEDRRGGEDGRSGLGRLRDFLFGRTDPPADRDDRFRPGEILAVDLSAESRGRLVRLGFEVREQRRLANLGVTVTRLSPPADRTLLEALELARRSDPATLFDLNHLYRGLSCEGCWASAAAVLQHEPGRCRARVRLGLLDTPVDRAHPTLARAHLRARSFVPPGTAPAPPDHGTAVASILVGAPPLGLLPQAELFAAEIFTLGPGGPEADALALSTGLDWLLQNRVGVVNASLAGPANRLVELAVFLAGRRGAVLVAAAGNGGPAAPPAYPAAYEGVVAVTAVDRELAPWRRANRGSYVAFAGPGVDVPVAATGGGVRPASGTSFAAPFVAAALAAAAGERDPRAVVAVLAGKAKDPGPPGRDPIFGYGLVQSVGCRR
jgi:minor extracellular protease Epr